MKKFIGKYVFVTIESYPPAFYFGKLEEVSKTGVFLSGARKIYRFFQRILPEQIAEEGFEGEINVMITHEVDVVVIGPLTILLCTEKAIQSLKQVPTWTNKSNF